MATPRLYHDDPLLSAFRARVVAHGSFGGRPSLVLDRTAFYPESGGQMADRGTLSDRPVVDVQVGEDGIVQHVLEGPLPEIGAELEGAIDRARRRLFMSLHTAQHMLSRALMDEAGAETLSARLGESGCTIDLDKSQVPDGRIAKAEALVSSVIDDDVPIKAWFPTSEELAALPLRRAPKVDHDIRVVTIGDFDVSPCGGTHCLRTAQVGVVRVVGVERQKGKLRINFDAGRRARDGWVAEAAALARLSARYTCGPLEVEAAVEKLERELASVRGDVKRISKEAAGPMAAALLTGGDGAIVAEVTGGRDLLRAVGAALAERSERLFVLATAEGEGLALLVGRGPNGSVDAGAALRAIVAAAGGKGGGRPDWAEGRLPVGVDLAKLVAQALGT